MARTKQTKQRAKKAKAALIKAKNTYNSKAIESIFGSPKKAWNKKDTPTPIASTTPTAAAAKGKKNKAAAANKKQQQKKNKSPTKDTSSKKKKKQQNAATAKKTKQASNEQLKQQQQLQEARLLSQQAARHNKSGQPSQAQTKRDRQNERFVSNGRSKKKNKNKNTPKTQKPPRTNNSVRKFNLQLPVVAPNAEPAPWWRNPKTTSSPRNNAAATDNDDNDDNVDSNLNSSYKILDAIVVKKDSLQVLTDEIVAFANYVRLNPLEIKSRHYLIKTIQDLSRDLFQVQPSDCQIFGSFAAQDVCTFESDIDLAIWGVVKPPGGDFDAAEFHNAAAAAANEQQRNQQVEEEEEEHTIDWSRKKAPPSAATATTLKPAPPVVHPNQRRQAKIRKWTAALDSHYAISSESKDVAETTNGNDATTETPATAETTTEGEGNTTAKNSHVETPTTTEAAVTTTSTGDNDEEPLLFVIDRVGEDDQEEADTKESSVPATKSYSSSSSEGILGGQDSSKTNSSEGASATARTVSVDSLPSQDEEVVGEVEDPSQFEDADVIESDMLENEVAAAAAAQMAAEEKLMGTSDANEESQFDDAPDDKIIPSRGDNIQNNDEDSNVNNSNSNDDSDNDSADKMEGLLKRKRSRTFSCDSETRLLNLPDADEVYHSTHASLPPQGTEKRPIDIDDDDDDEEEEEEIQNGWKTRTRSHSMVSLCSSASEASEKAAWDSSGMEVSFVTIPTAARPPSSNNNNNGAPSFGPTGETKVLIVQKLNLLQRWLRRILGRVGAIQHSHVRKNARVPIVNLTTSLGFECDIALGGHNGTDTSGYAGAQIKRFRSFSTVVLCLKVLLFQHDLDKPFSGGLGSFKLYVLVANHIERHLALGGSDNPGEILFTFLFRYGDAPGFSNVNKHARTSLTQLMVIKSGDGCAEMGSVHQVQNIVTMFTACWHRLQSKLKRNVNPEHSLLRYIVDPDKLESRRMECSGKAALVNRYAPRGFQSPTLFTRQAVADKPPPMPEARSRLQDPVLSKRRRAQKPAEEQPAEPEMPYRQTRAQRRAAKHFTIPGEPEVLSTDEEAEQLKASYGESNKSKKGSPGSPKKSRRQKKSKNKR